MKKQGTYTLGPKHLQMLDTVSNITGISKTELLRRMIEAQYYRIMPSNIPGSNIKIDPIKSDADDLYETQQSALDRGVQ